MATYVNNLRLMEIATGAESGTWGTKTNTNLELIADAFGSGTEAIATNADTHSTTVADGAADEGRAIYMKYTGALDSNCTISLLPNTINKFWLIENATTDSGSSGPYSIIISQGSGANITIGNGKVAAIFTDGAGGGAAVLDAFADLVVSDSFQVAGPNLTIGDAAAEDTKLLFDGNAQDFYIGLDDSADDLLIGVGSAVGTTPAITIDENADVAIADDLTLVSDAAVLNFGVNSDVSLTHVHDTGLLLNSTMQLQFNDASQYISGTSATVLSIAATDEIDLSATAVDLNGTLDVSGASTLTGAVTASSTLTVADDVKIAATKKLYFDGGSDLYIQGEVVGNQLDFVTSGVLALRMDGNGDVSIPNGTLDVSGASTLSGAVTASSTLTVADHVTMASTKNLYLDGGGDTYLGEQSADDFHIVVGDAELFRLVGNTVRVPGAYANTTGSAVNMRVSSAGDLSRSTSSLRYKADVVDYELEQAQSLIAALEPISYRHKEEDHRHLGFIAEAVHPHEPLLVVLNDDGEPDALEYDRLVVPLTAVVQSQMSEIAALTDRIAALEKDGG